MPHAESKYPEEVRELARQFSKFRYPITSQADLLEKAGGADLSFDFRGKKMKAGNAVMFIPAYYFPIVSEDNLIEKIWELMARYKIIKATKVSRKAT
jgi:hypothetical protein